MKSIRESIIGRKSSQTHHFYTLSNPRLNDLKHLDVLWCKNGSVYICIDPNEDRSLIGGNVFDAYRVDRWGHPAALGLVNFRRNLSCSTDNEYDIAYVYRNIFDDIKYYRDFQALWNIL